MTFTAHSGYKKTAKSPCFWIITLSFTQPALQQLRSHSRSSNKHNSQHASVNMQFTALVAALLSVAAVQAQRNPITITPREYQHSRSHEGCPNARSRIRLRCHQLPAIRRAQWRHPHQDRPRNLPRRRGSLYACPDFCDSSTSTFTTCADFLLAGDIARANNLADPNRIDAGTPYTSEYTHRHLDDPQKLANVLAHSPDQLPDLRPQQLPLISKLRDVVAVMTTTGIALCLSGVGVCSEGCRAGAFWSRHAAREL